MSLTQVNSGDRILASDLNAYYQLLKGVAASGENILLIYNAGALTLQPSSDPSAGTRVLTIKNNAGTTLFAARYDGLLEMLAAAAAPGTPVAGSVYWDIPLAALRVYDGTSWLNSGDASPNRWRWLYPGTAFNAEIVTGTGAVTAATVTERQLSTGANSASTASGRTLFRGSANFATGKMRRLEMQAVLDHIDANTSGYLLVTDENSNGVPSLTTDHIGIKNIAGVVSFTTADGTTEQATAITGNITASRSHTYVVLFDGTTVRLFVDGTLRATHATNVPRSTAAVQPCLRAYITNSAAANKTMEVDYISVEMTT